jgi:hypothetical protein
MLSPNKRAAEAFQVTADQTQVYILHPDLKPMHIPRAALRGKDRTGIEFLVLEAALKSGLILSNAETRTLAEAVQQAAA